MALHVDPRDPDAALLVFFKTYALENQRKSIEAGRPIYEDVDMCEIRRPGARDWMAYPATEFSHWVTDPITGSQRKTTYAERFPRQYRQFKEQQVQTKSGTPLEHVPFLTPARRAELNALNVLTVEQLALVDGQELRNLGQGGRDLKNRAQEYIESSAQAAPNMQMRAEMDAQRARIQLLEEDLARAKRLAAITEAEFDGMTDEQLRRLIETNTGHAPQGQINRKTLVRMAMESRPNKAA